MNCPLATDTQNIYIVSNSNPTILKIAQLLAQYLYTNNRLDLPGIGTFRIEVIVNTELKLDKQGKPIETRTISFQNDPAIKDAPELVDFITSQTGKMKPLAVADLNSHLELAKQFLNISKPFLFEGIGNLVKIKSGEYEFTSDNASNEKLKEYSPKEITSPSSPDDSFANYENILSPKNTKRKWATVIVVLLIISGISVAVWTGYKVYKNRVSNNDVTITTEPKNEQTLPATSDSLQITKKRDTVITEKPVIPEGNYRFVVEVAEKERALERYNTLKGWTLKIQMETKDSATFKLYFLLPANISDTSRILDSLRILYTPPWSKAFVER